MVTSSLTWLSYDAAERERTLKLIELFKEHGTVDELGVGSIRDTFADALFPGTSVIQTRARYFLFIPWLLERAGDDARRGKDAVQRLRELEIKLIYSLLAGGERQGVIGQSARDKLKRMPSEAYWAGLGRYGIRTTDTTIGGFFRDASTQGVVRHRAPEVEDGATPVSGAVHGLDPDLRSSCPPPEDLLTATTLSLTEAEAAYLRDRMVGSTPGSLLAWLLASGRRADVDYVWEHPDAGDFPAHLRRVVDHGERFHHAIFGALLVYNLLLAEKQDSQDLVDHYRDQIAFWHDEMADADVWRDWQRDEFWQLLGTHNRRLHPRTRAFVNAWLDGAVQSQFVGDDPTLRNLVRRREYELKRTRARLENQAALDRWQGASGLVRLDYRWGISNQMITDIFDGLSVA